MKKDTTGILTTKEPGVTSLPSFKAMDKDKDNSSLPFPSSVLLTKPIGSNDHELPSSSSFMEHSANNATLPSLNEFLGSFAKPPYPISSSSSGRTHPSPSTPSSSSIVRGGRADGDHAYPYPHDLPPHQQQQYQYQHYMQQQQQLLHLREQQYMEQQFMEHHNMHSRGERAERGERGERGEREQHRELREQHRELREQHRELREQLHEQFDRHREYSHFNSHDYPYGSSYPHDAREPQRRSGLPEAFGTKREEQADSKLSVREQLKLNLRQRDASFSDTQWSPRASAKAPPPPPSFPPSKHSSGYSQQHIFAVPSSPLASPASSPGTFVPTTPKQSQAPTQPQFDSKFTNYTLQEFQQQPVKPTTPTSAPSSSILANNGGKWNAWGNEKDVYKQAKILSVSLQNNVKDYIAATQPREGYPATVPTTPVASNVPLSPISSRTVPTVILPPVSSAPSTPKTPRASTSSSSSPSTSTPPTTTKRKASADMLTPPSKVPSLSPAQQTLQAEAQLFSSKDIKSGMQRLNSLMSSTNLLDIYNKFNRHDEYSLCHTTSHIPPSSSSSSSSSSSPTSTSSPSSTITSTSTSTNASPMSIDLLTKQTPIN